MEKKHSKGFRDLIAWQKAMDLAELVYQITKNFPSEEKYGIISQMRRSAVSIPSNIAEGQIRNSKKEFTQFISIALGSCAELATQIELSKRFGYIDDDILSEISEKIGEEMKILHGLRKTLKSNTNH